MRRRYLCDMLRHMRYYACSTWGNGEPDSYMLQIVTDYQMVYSEKANTDTDLIKGAKAAGVPIRGQHYADYMVPENALEKRMLEDLETLSAIVAKLATVEALEAIGYSKKDAKKILKNAQYIAPNDKN